MYHLITLQELKIKEVWVKSDDKERACELALEHACHHNPLVVEKSIVNQSILSELDDNTAHPIIDNGQPLDYVYSDDSIDVQCFFIPNDIDELTAPNYNTPTMTQKEYLDWLDWEISNV